MLDPYLNLFFPDFHLSLESLDLCYETHSFRSVGCINRLLLKICTRLKEKSDVKILNSDTTKTAVIILKYEQCTFIIQ